MRERYVHDSVETVDEVGQRGPEGLGERRQTPHTGIHAAVLNLGDGDRVGVPGLGELFLGHARGASQVSDAAAEGVAERGCAVAD